MERITAKVWLLVGDSAVVVLVGLRSWRQPAGLSGALSEGAITQIPRLSPLFLQSLNGGKMGPLGNKARGPFAVGKHGAWRLTWHISYGKARSTPYSKERLVVGR